MFVNFPSDVYSRILSWQSPWGGYPGRQHSIPIQSHRTSAVLYETAPMPTAINTPAFFQLNNLSISPRPGYHLGPLNFRISSADFSHSA